MIVKNINKIILILVFCGLGINTAFYLPDNLKRVEIIKAWLSVKPTGLIRSNDLRDNLPDGWSLEAWGNSTQIIRIDNKDVYRGNSAALVLRTNSEGGAALTQDVKVEAGKTYSISFFVKGSDGALQLWFHDLKGTWIKTGFGGWLSFPAHSDWTQEKLVATIPPGVDYVKLLFRAKEKSLFDETYLGVLQNGVVGPNLLHNPGFEQDGISEDLLIWWQNVTDISPLPSVDAGSSRNLGFSNILDMSRMNLGNIERRAQEIGNDCANRPGMTAWLLALGDNFEKAGGAAARESLYQLSIKLAPNCPQPYAALADLYSAHRAYESAAQYYQLAAEKSFGTSLAGRYYFNEGLILLRNIGDTRNAITAFEMAQRYDSWEHGAWYLGASTYFLGNALEQAGRIPEAIQAYQRVVGCQACSVQAKEAKKRLSNMENPKKK